MERISEHCQRKSRVRRTLHVCLSCERKGRRSAARLCCRTFRIVCQNCGDSPDCIPPIDIVGRVVRVHGKQLYLAPCCGKVQEYTGTGRDFSTAKYWIEGSPCQHTESTAGLSAKEGGQKGRKPKYSCQARSCSAQGLAKQHIVVDHLEGKMEVVHLCQKHTPPEEMMKRAKNFKQFCQCCEAWDARPKGANGRSSFRKR